VGGRRLADQCGDRAERWVSRGRACRRALRPPDSARGWRGRLTWRPAPLPRARPSSASAPPGPRAAPPAASGVTPPWPPVARRSGAIPTRLRRPGGGRPFPAARPSRERAATGRPAQRHDQPLCERGSRVASARVAQIRRGADDGW